MKMYTQIILACCLLLLISACKKDEIDTTPTLNLKGKIAPSLYFNKDGDIEFYDLREVDNPMKAAFNVIGTTAENIQLQYIKSRPIGINTVKEDYGNLTINSYNERYLADRNWANWTSISIVRNFLVMNNDSTNQLYTSYQDEEGITKFYDYISFFQDFASIGNWGTPGTINSCIEVYEAYNDSNYTRNAFYINLETQEYLFEKDLNSSGGYFNGYRITDLIKTPNGNMDTDPIDWTKADFAFSLSYNHNYESFTYNGKEVSVVYFVDIDTKTYAAFARNVEDDAVNGADNGRQTLLTTSWQPLSNLMVGWDL